VDGVAGDLEHQQEMLVEGAARPLEVHVEKTPIVRLACFHHYVVDRGRKVTEESLEWSRIGGVEGRYAQRFELAGGALKTLGIPAGEGQPGPLSACSSGRFEPNASAAANTTTVCPRSSGSRGTGTVVVAVLMIPPGTRDREPRHPAGSNVGPAAVAHRGSSLPDCSATM
jgi:hypothetical protein